MKAKQLILLIATLMLFSCNSDDDNEGVTPELTDYEYFEDAQMVFESNQGFETLSIEPGDYTVFKYYYKAREDSDIADDEYAESIYFQVDGDLNSFSYSDQELRPTDLFIRRSCFCASTGYVYPNVGTITGTKRSNGNWDVSINITFVWDEFSSEAVNRNITGQFSLAPIPQ